MLMRLVRIGLAFFVVAMLAPVLVRSATTDWGGIPWHQASRAPTGLAPDPARERGAVVQVYAARTFSWRGIFAVHSWIITKDRDADRYRRFDMVGWGGGRVRRDYAPPDALWFGSRPTLLADHRGPAAEALIPRIDAAIASYPWDRTYRTYPGPNSNTFIAHVARSVPELGVDLPPTAIGKDYRAPTDPIGRPPSGRGVQISILGLAGLIVSPVEGVEINLLGLSAGLDPSPALRLPGWGRLGWTG